MAHWDIAQGQAKMAKTAL